LNVLSCCSAAGNWKLCLAMLNTMNREGVKPKAFHYNVAMAACNKVSVNAAHNVKHTLFAIKNAWYALFCSQVYFTVLW
jgi:pentatricopeptide repeat protein